MVNHWYFYGFDAGFGPFYVKFCGYFPYTGQIYLNGHEYAKRQCARAGIGFTALDNAFGSADDPAAVQRICDGLTDQAIYRFAGKWLARLPHPFTRADEDADYRWQLSVQQAEFSTTMALDRPASGRIFFEQLIRDNLDIGRPDKVNIVFDRKIRLRGKNPARENARGHDRRPDQLRPAQAPRPSDHRAHPAQPRLPGHRRRPDHRPVPHPADPAAPDTRPRPAHQPRTTRPQPTPASRPCLPRRPDRPRPASIPRRLTQPAAITRSNHEQPAPVISRHTRRNLTRNSKSLRGKITYLGRSTTNAAPSSATAHSGNRRPAGSGLSVPPPLGCSHRLNGLPVQRSVIHARCPGRGGRQAVSRQSSTQICWTLTLEWPTLILASRSRWHSQFLIPWRVMINGHVLKLVVGTGYQAHFRLPACRLDLARRDVRALLP